MSILRITTALADCFRKLRFRFMIAPPLVWMVMIGTRGEAMTISTHGSYTILAGVHEDDAQTVHAAMIAFGGLSPIYLDAYGGNGTVYYSSIWKKMDGVYREISLEMSVQEVRDRMAGNLPANRLLMVDAWTRNEGTIGYGEGYHPAWSFQTFCCGIWTDEDLPERRFEYRPMQGTPWNDGWEGYWDNYYLTGGVSFPERDQELREDGFRLLSATVVRPSWKNPLHLYTKETPYDPEYGEAYDFDRNSIVALYEKTSVSMLREYEATLDEAQDYVDDQQKDGYQPIRIEGYQGHPFGALWSQDPEAWGIRFGIITRKDDRFHQVIWGYKEKDIDYAHQMMHYGSMQPVAITASRYPGLTSDQWRYTLIFREKDIRVKDSHDPARDLKPDSRFDPDDPSTW